MRRFLLTMALLLTSACSRRPPEPLLDLTDFKMTSVGPNAVRPFARKDLLGRAWIAEFIFTHCAGPCPLLTERLAALSRNLPESVGVLCVTVDPEEDTPQRLRQYARDHGLDVRRWVFLRGTPEQTYQLLFAGFRLPMSTRTDASPEARVTHSTRFVLLDRKAAIRGYYDGLGDLDNQRLARDARRLVEEGL